MTINRFSKETGGLAGITENPGTSERWARINHFLAALKQHLHLKTGRKLKCYEIELGKARKEKDEEDVKILYIELEHGHQKYGTKTNQQIVSFHSGKLASAEMSKNVLTSRKRGENAMSDFISRFTSTGEYKIKRQVVHTFDKNGKTKKRNHSVTFCPRLIVKSLT